MGKKTDIEALREVHKLQSRITGMSPHKHEFVIPVEWKYFSDRDARVRRDQAYKRVVSKLRCACGEETDR